MSSRASSRVYNTPALERWFENVGVDWETAFTQEALRRGREIYRKGLISGVELAEEEAIVHCAFSRKDTCYAVIEWTKEGPSVRSSTDDDYLGNAVAVAGLYEVEELIADEIGPLPYTPVESEGLRPEADEIKTEASEPTTPVSQARNLTPCLEGSPRGLRLTAYWTDAQGRREPAFSDGETAIQTEEREAVVRLTGRAREAGFEFRRARRDFLLSDLERVPSFFTHTRQRWEASFGPLEFDLEAQRMAEGVQEVKVVGQVKASAGNGMRVDWRLKLGRKWLDLADAERLAKAGRGIHIVRGLGLVRVGEEEGAALSEWQVSVSKSSAHEKEWPRYMVFSLFADRGAKLDLPEEMRLWRDRLVGSGLKGEGGPYPGFLRDYQRQGVEWMARLRECGAHGLLADEMGLGKTLQVLTLLQAHPAVGKDSLIVCPASVVPVWESEAGRWYPDLRTSVLGKGNAFLAEKSEERPRLWIASYTQLRRHKHLLEGMYFGYAVLDEAQQIKNPDAKVTHACCSIRAECRLALTGTPIENRLLDLWTIFRFLMPGLLGSRRRFEEAVESKSVDFREVFERLLRRQLTPFLLRREKNKVGKDLPPKVEMDLVCPITDLQRQCYQGLLERGREELGDDLHRAMQGQSMHFFSLLTRLRQACCDPGLLPNVSADIRQSGKIQTLLIRLEELLEVDGDHKVVIFSQFVTLLKRLKPVLRERFPKVALMELTGQTQDRSKPVDSFQRVKGPAVILVSLRAGGMGITLHAADYVFLLDPWWNPAVENQAVDRVHRIGQDRRVFVYRMITQGTVEARIQELKQEKRILFENTLGHLGSAKDLAEHFGDLEDLAKLLPAE